jgi:hypothetical protein
LTSPFEKVEDSDEIGRNKRGILVIPLPLIPPHHPDANRDPGTHALLYLLDKTVKSKNMSFQRSLQPEFTRGLGSILHPGIIQGNSPSFKADAQMMKGKREVNPHPANNRPSPCQRGEG